MRDFIQALPKVELHLHIEGTLEPGLLFELAQRNKVSIPFKSETEVRDAYEFSDLQSFLDIYYQGANVLIHEQDFFDLTWDSLPKLAQTHYWYLPARWLVLDQYNSVENLRGFDGNLAVVLAEKDEVVPAKHGRKLYKSIEARKKLWVFEGARHNSVPTFAELHW